MGTEQAIAQAALEVLSHSRIDQLTVRDIAARAGVNVATVHYYFRTKEGILSAALREFFTPVLQELQAVLASDLAPSEKLLSFLAAYLDNFQAHPGVFQSLISAIMAAQSADGSSPPSPAEQVLLEMIGGAKHHLLGLIRDISGVEDSQQLVFLTLRTMTSVLHPLLFSRLPLAVLGVDFSQKEIRRRYLAEVVASLDARPGSATL